MQEIKHLKERNHYLQEQLASSVEAAEHRLEEHAQALQCFQVQNQQLQEQLTTTLGQVHTLMQECNRERHEHAECQKDWAQPAAEHKHELTE